MTIRLASVLLALLLLGSCATLSEDQCRAGDWRAIGVADGREGQPLDRLAHHAEACAEYGIAPDRSAWLAGREAGLRAYCTPQNAYEIGRQGRRVAPVCPPAAAAAMAAPNAFGMRWHDIGREIDDLAAEVRRIDNRLARLGDGDPELRADLLVSRSRLRLELSRLRLQRLRYETWR